MTEREMDMKKNNGEVLVKLLSNKNLDPVLICATEPDGYHLFLPRDPEQLREIIRKIIWLIYHDNELYDWLDAEQRDGLVTDIIDDITDQQIIWEREVGIDLEDE